MSTTLDWLRERSDDDLVALLVARPDLALPAPSDLSVLARRLDSPPSVWRVMEGLNRFQVQLLQAMTLLSEDGGEITTAGMAELLGPRATAARIRTGLAALETLALVRGGAKVEVSAAVPPVLGEFPAGLGPPGTLSADQVATALAAASTAELALLDRLNQGQPRGVVGSTGPAADLARALVDAGLLVRPAPGTVLLTRQAGLALRRPEGLGPVQIQLPKADPVGPGEVAVDGTAAAQAVAAVTKTGRLLTALGRHPGAALKTGGLGVRELRRLAKQTDTDESVTALLLEICAAASMIAPSEPRTTGLSSVWTPTHLADEFLSQDEETAWVQLAQTWLELRREPARIGRRDTADKLITALSPEVSWVRGPADRSFVLSLLADLPRGTALSEQDLGERMAWLAPLRPAERRDPLAAAVVAEATELGLAAFGALAGAARRLLAGDPAGAAARLSDALPDPVDQVLVQADLTVIAPGRLDQQLATRLEQLADVESAGSATVYRVTETSLRRAFDLGATAADLHRLFQTHSATGIPQALTYLIDDVARRHGVLRIGAAGCYLRSDDPTLIDAAITHAAAVALRVRRLAPTVAVSTAGIEELLDALRAAGLAPAAEDEGGLVVDLVPAPHRTRPVPVGPGRRREPAEPNQEQLRTLIGRMRAVDTSAVSQVQSPTEALQLLRQAAKSRSSVWIGYVDSEGGTSRRLIEPIAVSGGAIAAFDRLRQATRTFALHRVSEVSPADSTTGIED